MAPTLPEVLAACKGTRDDFNNWHRRGLLSEEIPETSPGVARHMTREAALEIGFMIALVDVGFDVGKASSCAQDYVDKERAHKLSAWLVHDPVDDRELHFGAKGAKTQFLDIAQMLDAEEGSLVGDPGEKSKPRPATRFAVVNLAEIVRRVDALFQSKPD